MLKIGIVGTGKFGQNHARILTTMANIQFVGLYDKNMERAKEIAQKLNVSFYETLDELLDKIDALVVVVTTIYHYEIAKKALEKGISVFIEKPITETYEQAQELIAIAKENKTIIQVGHVERFNPIIMKLQDKIGDPIFIEAHRIAPFSIRGTDIPVVQELMIHDIDLILAFIHSKVTDIRASGSNVLTNKVDIANARLEFENGAVANITASRISLLRSRKLRFFQKDAYFSVDFQTKKAQYVGKSADFYSKLPMMMKNPTSFDPTSLVDIENIDANDFEKDSLTMELESFVDCVVNKKKPLVDGVAGSRALKIANIIVEKINDK